MNLFNEAIYKNHLEHTAAGTKWGKHKYLYITPSGRYVYPEDVAKGKTQQQFRSRQINDQIKSAHVNGTAKTPEDIRRQQINDQIKSAHQGGTSRNPEDMRKAKALSDMSGMKLSSTHKLNRLAKEYGTNSKEFKEHLKTLSEGDDEQAKKMLDVINGNKAAKTSGTAAGSKVVSTKTEESKKMGLSDDDLKNMKINTQATNRDEVLKNIALRVIRGDYGNGADRKAKLGNYYDEVQKKVNEVMNSEGQSSQNKTSSSSTNLTKKEQKVEKTETQKRNVEEIQIAKELSDVTGMKNSATLNLVKMYKQDSKSKKFQEELSDLAEGNEKQKQRMLRILGYMKHEDLEEGLFLKHWGIKRRSGRYKFGSGDRPYQHESGHTRKNSTFHDRRTMSDEELQKSIDRVRKEVELYRTERDNRSQGQRFVEDVLTSIGKDVLRTAGKGALLWAGKKFASEVLNDDELGEFIARGGPKKEKNK